MPENEKEAESCAAPSATTRLESIHRQHACKAYVLNKPHDRHSVY
jgi:hypothetical protein